MWDCGAVGPSYVALGGMLIPTGSACALQPLPTGQTLAMDAAVNSEGAALAVSTMAGAAADAVPAEHTRAEEAADTVGAEIVTATSAADAVSAELTTAGAGADVVPAEIIAAAAVNTADAVLADAQTSLAPADTVDAVMTDMTTAAAADATDAVLVEHTRAAAAADSAEIKVAIAEGAASKMKLQKQVADQAAGDAAEGAVAAKTQRDNTRDSKHVSMADKLHSGSPAAFIAAAAFSGTKGGMLFKTGDQGLGYYADTVALVLEAPMESSTKASPKVADSRCRAPSLAAREGDSKGSCKGEVEGQVKGEGVGGKADKGVNAGHYWGQALQSVDCSVQVCHPLKWPLHTHCPSIDVMQVHGTLSAAHSQYDECILQPKLLSAMPSVTLMNQDHEPREPQQHRTSLAAAHLPLDPRWLRWHPLTVPGFVVQCTMIIMPALWWHQLF